MSKIIVNEIESKNLSTTPVNIKADIDIASGKVLKINNTTVLTSTHVHGKSMPGGSIVGHNDEQTLYSKNLAGFTLSGDMTVNAAVDIDLVDNNASALSFDAPGKSGILEIDTTDNAEKVKMSGDAEIAGEIKAGSHYFRHGISSVQTSGTINLSNSTFLIYSANYVSGGGATVTSGSINFTNGSPGEIIYLRVISNGSYTFGANMKFPSDIAPQPSASGKVDIYSFMCITATEYLGAFAFNYSVTA